MLNRAEWQDRHQHHRDEEMEVELKK